MSRVRPSRGGRWGGSLEQEEDPGRSSLISEDRFPRNPGWGLGNGTDSVEGHP